MNHFFNKLVGEDESFSIQHRLLNVVLIFSVILSVLSGIGNIVLALGPVLISISFGCGLLSLFIYYLSFIKRKYSAAMLILTIICIFLFTPILWIYNGGSSGVAAYFILFFSSIITALLRGKQRCFAFLALVGMTLTMIVLEYNYPEVIVPYADAFSRFGDIAISLALILWANIAFIAVLITYYIKEYDRSRSFATQLVEQKMEMKLQKNIQAINEKLQQEIEERRQIEQTLRLSEERFMKSFKESPVPMCIFSWKNHLFLDVNTSFLNTFEYESNEILGQTLLELHLSLKLEACLFRVMEEKKAVYNLQLPFLTKSGAEKIGLFSVELLEINEEPCLLCVINDITEHIRLEKEVTRLDHLNLIGEMAASLGHEVRNPLTTVRGFLQMFQAKREFTSQREYFDLMIEELDRANSIITEFLSLAKNKKIDLARHDLNTIISKIYPLLQADALGAGKTITLELNDIPEIQLDEDEIRQYILNIVRNGLDAISYKGNIIIKTYLDLDQVILEIKDNGTGIPPEVLTKFGTPFMTTKNNGTGLGIPICYRIAERHEAKIEIETGSSGTIFRLKLKKQLSS